MLGLKVTVMVVGPHGWLLLEETKGMM